MADTGSVSDAGVCFDTGFQGSCVMVQGKVFCGGFGKIAKTRPIRADRDSASLNPCGLGTEFYFGGFCLVFKNSVPDRRQTLSISRGDRVRSFGDREGRYFNFYYSIVIYI